MSEQEQELEDLQDRTAEDTSETVEEAELPTYEEYLALKERLEKAEKKIVENKKSAKLNKKESANAETDSSASVDELVERKLAEREFYRENPDAKAYKESIDSYVRKGLSHDEAYMLASKKDREIESNSNAYGKPQVAGRAEGTESVQLVTVSQFDKMSSSEQAAYLGKTASKFGEVKFK